MSENILDKMIKAKKDHETAQVVFFNTGAIKTEDNGSARRIYRIDNVEQIRGIETVLCDATNFFARGYEFDSINMGLDMGLIYDVNAVGEDNKVRPNAKPVDGIVRYYIGSINCFKDGNQTNKIDYGEIAPTRQGYIDFDKFISVIEGSGLDYNGPKTFDTFKEMILSGEQFDISLNADFKEKEQTVETVPEVIEEKPLEAKQPLIKKLFNRR
jgi:hypothetical protein